MADIIADNYLYFEANNKYEIQMSLLRYVMYDDFMLSDKEKNSFQF